ncbi:MAG: carbohydrate-binding domain-containing protein [Clostridia bacterium]|nr:carbohydrate-binding domain-containing protein [Clostridia bacterium]
MKSKKFILVISIALTIALIAVIAAVITGCGTNTSGVTQTGEETVPETPTVETEIDEDELFSDRDYETEYDEDATVDIVFDGTTAMVDGSGATFADGVLTISKKGTYKISGTLTEGYVVVNCEDKKVQIILSNASITSASTAPIYILQADKVFITLEGDNSLTTTGEFVAIDDNSIDGAIFSKDDLTINGSGSLTIACPYGHGIVCKDELVITGGSITINCLGHGLDVNDSICVSTADMNITSGKDGMHAENDDDATLGYIFIEDGTYTIKSAGDGISAGSVIQIKGGTYNITTNGGSSNSYTATTDSFKGIKATSQLVISGGTFTINSLDDSIHCNDSMEISGGTFTISSGDDGIHADTSIVISGGNITITKSFEGVEAQNINITGGTLSITASDDGINAAGGVDGSSTGRPGENPFTSTSNSYIKISGGTITVNASGDGIDANGSLYISGGKTIVYGPTNNGNGALDYDSVAQITGGEFLALGSSGMAQGLSSSSTQCNLMYNLNSTYAANTAIALKDSSGNVICSYTAAKQFSSVVMSSPDITLGETYTLTVGNSSYTIKFTSVTMSNGNQGGTGGGQPPRR